MARKGSSGSKLRAKYAKYRTIMKRRALEAQRRAQAGQAAGTAPPLELNESIALETADLVDFSEDAEESFGNLDTPEGVCAMAIKTLRHLVQLPRGIVYLPNREETLLVPRCAFGIDMAINLDMNKEALTPWAEEKAERPFNVKREKEEPPFREAFPTSAFILPNMELLVGIPFITQKKFLGMAYFGGKESDVPPQFEELYREDVALIEEFTHEVAESLLEIRMGAGETILGMWSETTEVWHPEEPEEDQDREFQEILQGDYSNAELMQFLKDRFMGGSEKH
jgi:hypothetical protein